MFLFDDLQFIVENPEIRRLWPPTILTWRSLRPLSFYSFAVNHALDGYEVWSYHALTLAFHVAAALTLFGFARRALRLPRVGLSDGEASAAAFVVALFWAVHPLNSQAVVYVIQRAEVMAGLGVLLSLYCLVRAAESDDERRRRRWLIGTALAFYVGLGCKEVAVVAPALLYLFDALVLTGSFAEPLRRRRGLYAALLAPFVIVPLLWLVVSPWRFATLRSSADAGSALEYAWTQGAVILSYLRRVVWPSGLNLDHAWDPAQHEPEVPAAAALVAAALVATIEAVRRRAAVGWLGAAFFLVLAPTSSFHPLSDRMVEHRMYLATIPCVALVVLGARRVLARLAAKSSVRRVVAAGAVAATAAALGAATSARCLDYSSAERMWLDVVAKAPHNARAHYNLGCVLYAAGDEDAALDRFREAIRLRPSYVAAHNNAAAVLVGRRRFEEAAEHLKTALSHGDPAFDSLRNYGNVLMELRRYDDAALVLRRAEDRLAWDPRDRATAARLANDIGLCRERAGARDDAVACFRRAVALDPASAGPWTNLASALAATGRLGEAIDAYLGAVAADPRSPTARVKLVALCVNGANVAAARSHLEETVRREPTNAEAARVLEFVRRAR